MLDEPKDLMESPRSSTMPKDLKPLEVPKSSRKVKPKALLKSISVGVEHNVASPLRKMSDVGRKMASVLPWRRGSISSQSSNTDSIIEEAKSCLDPEQETDADR